MTGEICALTGQLNIYASDPGDLKKCLSGYDILSVRHINQMKY